MLVCVRTVRCSLAAALACVREVVCACVCVCLQHQQRHQSLSRRLRPTTQHSTTGQQANESKEQDRARVRLSSRLTIDRRECKKVKSPQHMHQLQLCSLSLSLCVSRALTVAAATSVVVVVSRLGRESECERTFHHSTSLPCPCLSLCSRQVAAAADVLSLSRPDTDVSMTGCLFNLSTHVLVFLSLPTIHVASLTLPSLHLILAANCVTHACCGSLSLSLDFLSLVLTPSPRVSSTSSPDDCRCRGCR